MFPRLLKNSSKLRPAPENHFAAAAMLAVHMKYEPRRTWLTVVIYWPNPPKKNSIAKLTTYTSLSG